MQEYFEVGQIVNTFGIKGFLKVKPFTDEITRFEELKSVYIVLKNKMQEMQIEDVNYQKEMVLLKLKGIDDLTNAEKYKGCYLKIARRDAKKLPKDTYFIADLIGLEVYSDENNEYLGKVEDIFRTGANDVYVVKNELGKQILLPGIKEVLKEIDLEKGKIIVHLMKGLI